MTVVLHAPPDLSTEIAAAGVPFANSSQTYVVSYRNDGSIEARDVVLVLTVPERMGFDWADFDGKYDPAARTVTWALSDLPRRSRRPHPESAGRIVRDISRAGGSHLDRHHRNRPG